MCELGVPVGEGRACVEEVALMQRAARKGGSPPSILGAAEIGEGGCKRWGEERRSVRKEDLRWRGGAQRSG